MNRLSAAVWIAVMGLGMTALQAGSISCDFPVVKSEPIYKTVIKKIPRKECWEEEQKSKVDYNLSKSAASSQGVIVCKKCIVTKCKVVYDAYKEKVLVGYKNYAKCGCNTFYKVSEKKLKSIKTTIIF